MKLIVLFLVATVTTGVFPSQDGPLTLRVDSSLVSVDFTVTNGTGQAITDLTRNDFEVLDNGEMRPIQNFAPVETPFNILMLLDCSESTKERMNLLLSSMGLFSSRLRPQDKVAIAIFGTEVEIVKDWKVDKIQPIRMAEAPACHGTNFYSAIDWAEKKLSEVQGRRGIIIFSDGGESDIARKNVTVNGLHVRQIVPPSEDRDFQMLLKKVRSGAAPIYMVAVDTDVNPGRRYIGSDADLKQIRARMELLAHDSGGRIAFPRESLEVVPLFLQIGNELGISYSLGFSPAKSKTPGSHKFEIRARTANVTVHQSRDTYVSN